MRFWYKIFSVILIMKILIATDSFKGTFSSLDAGEIIRSAFSDCGFDDVTVLAVSDGGDGLIEAARFIDGGRVIRANVKNPFFNEVTAKYVMVGDTAVIESAEACGLAYGKDVMNATTYGVGQLILSAISNGAKKIILGLGGSGTNDGGAGMACALGAKFYDTYSFIPVGRNLVNVKRTDLSKMSKKLDGVEIIGCFDVDSPFCGEYGAAYRFARQKGATPAEVERLDEGLSVFADAVGIDKTLPGSGAAGGLGGGIAAFLGGKLKKGFDVMSSLLGIENAVKNADVVITGEGKTDIQTLAGKLPYGIADLCYSYGRHCILISGCTDGDIEPIYDAGVSQIFTCYDKIPKTLDKDDAKKRLYSAACRAAESLR